MHRRLSRSNWLERKILLGVLGVVKWPKVTLCCAAVLLVASCVSALLYLNVSSDEDKLFSPDLPVFRNYLEFDRKFPENDALYVVIESKNSRSAPPLLRWTAAADAVAQQVQKLAGRYVESIDARVPLDKLGAQGLLFQPAGDLHDTFDGAVQFSQLAGLWGERIDRSRGVLPEVAAFIGGRTPSERFLTGLMAVPVPDSKMITFAREVAAGWNDTLSHPDQPIRVGGTVPDLAALAADDPGDLGYYWQPDASDPDSRKHPDLVQHLLLVRIYPHVNYNTLSSVAEPVAAIRAAVKVAAGDFPEFSFGTTGRPALDADEMETTDRDSNIAEIVAAIAIFIGLWVMLRSLWLALVAEIALAVGIGWTFGWATVTVHELNLLSIVFLIALIGIGMDYLVQILTRYRTEARRRQRPKAIWTRVFRSVSAPINTACLGAAGAFFVSCFTRFQGAAELGIIAGGGLLLCLLAGYTVLPALLTVFPAWLSVDIARRPGGRTSAERVNLPTFITARYIAMPLGARRLLLPAAWVCLIGLCSPFAFRTHFDANLLDLQAPRLESTQLIRKLQTWSSVVLSKDTAMLDRVRKAVEKARVVASTESILITDDNYRWLKENQARLPKVNWSRPPPMQAGDVEALANRASRLADRLSELPGPDSAKDRNATAESLRAFAATALKIPRQEAANRLSAWQEAFVVELQDMLARVSPKPFNLPDVPPELRNHLVSADGTRALYIYPNPELDLWNRRELAAFVNQVNDAVATVPGHPDVTGLAPQIYYTTREVRSSFRKAATLALIVIVVLVMIDLRNIRDTLLAISVLALGLPLLVELMGVLNVNWNFANFFGLPILIGAGHEYGVFMIHRYRETLRDPRRTWRFWDVADRALLLCAYITSSSFGFFWAISEHRGLKSLGLVMALGTACIYLSTLMVLRPLLLWQLERRLGKNE